MRRTVTDSRGAVDVPVAARAASLAFTVLVLGGLAAPLASAALPVVGAYWLVVVAVVAFATAGARIGQAGVPLLHGASAALGGYLLVLPVVFVTSGIRLDQVVTTATAAVVVGAAAGYLRGRFRSATPQGVVTSQEDR